MTEERKMPASEVVDFIENKVQIDVGVLSAEDIVKTTEVFDRAIELIEEAENLETELAINTGAMRAYQEAFENAHDEAVKDFSYFLIDKAKDGCIQINDLPDLVVEWSSTEGKDAELMKDVNAAFDEAAEAMKPSPALRATSPEGRGKKLFLTCRNPEAEHWILKRFTDSSRRWQG